MKFFTLTILTFSVSLMVLAACNRDYRAPLTIVDSTPPNVIMNEGDKLIAEGKYAEAGDYFLEIERLYPFTNEAERALIKAAKAYHDDGALVESRTAATRYLQFFPGGQDAALAQYLVALSYYDGIVDIGRDQSLTFNALQELQKVMDNYPASEYAALAAPKFEIALDQLAGKEVDIGRYYLRNKNFTAAIARFKAVVEEYPPNPHTPEAYHRLIEAYYALGLLGEAQAVFNEFAPIYPGNAWVEASRALLATGRQPNAGDSSLFRQVITGDWI